MRETRTHGSEGGETQLNESSLPLSVTTNTGKTEIVYNLRVAIDHTYFVGDNHRNFAVWVHNTQYVVGGVHVSFRFFVFGLFFGRKVSRVWWIGG